jgi:hypothetical protein
VRSLGARCPAHLAKELEAPVEIADHAHTTAGELTAERSPSVLTRHRAYPRFVSGD